MNNYMCETINFCFISVAILFGTLLRKDNVEFTATMSASSNSSTLCGAQNKAQYNVENLLKKYLSDNKSEIIAFDYYIEYTNKICDQIINKLCYAESDTYSIEINYFEHVDNVTTINHEDSLSDNRAHTKVHHVEIFKDQNFSKTIGNNTTTHQIVQRNGSNDEDISSMLHYSANISEPIDCVIKNNRTHQKINTSIILNSITGSGSSEILFEDSSHDNANATVFVSNSRLSKNGFNITHIDNIPMKYVSSKNIINPVAMKNKTLSSSVSHNSSLSSAAVTRQSASSTSGSGGVASSTSGSSASTPAASA